ncbi:hypothetical protein [Edwardsiella tarda]|nr:hypothetical protein [Edwardsiella tarda]UCQ12767.1 hypothetical protein DCF76_07635 [Edwardsiella tarda]BEH72300.1 hypothetical protein GBS0709_14170 [Edwardsiella tarda]
MKKVSTLLIVMGLSGGVCLLGSLLFLAAVYLDKASVMSLLGLAPR